MSSIICMVLRFKKIFSASIYFLLIIFSFLSFAPLVQAQAEPPAKAAPEEPKEYSCNCGLVLQGKNPRLELCSSQQYKVKIKIGDGAPPGEETFVADLFDEKFAQDLIRTRKCYPLDKKNDPFAE